MVTLSPIPIVFIPSALTADSNQENWLLNRNLVKVNSRNCIPKSLLNDSVRNMINEQL